MLNEKEIALMGLCERAGDSVSTAMALEENLPAAIIALLHDLDGARYAAAQHLQTVETQAKIIAGYAAPSAQQAASIDTGELRKRLCMAAINCSHMIESEKVTLYRNEGEEGNALSQMADRLSVALDGILHATPAQPIAPQTVRKAFICKGCDGVYADEKVTQCDCMPVKQEYTEGTITYPVAQPIAVSAPTDDLANAIFALRSPVPKFNNVYATSAYLDGHYDARRAAMDLVMGRAARAAAPVSGPQHIPSNFTTHRAAWRDAITECINREMANSSQAAYWEHELAAYDRAFARLLDKPERSTTPAAPVSGQDASIFADEEFMRLSLALRHAPSAEKGTAMRKLADFIDSRPRSEDSRAKVSGDQNEN